MNQAQMNELLKKLCNAIKNQDHDTVEECLKSKPPLHLWVDDKNYLTPWHWAHSYGTYSIIYMLLKAGADPNYKLERLNYETALFGAVARHSADIVKLLVKNGADINAVDDDNLTPLHFAVIYGRSDREMINVLLTLGADISAGQSIIPWMRRDYPDNEELFYEAFDYFLDEIEEEDNTLYKKNIDRLAKFVKVYKDIPEYLVDRIPKPPSHNSLDHRHEDDEVKPNNKDNKLAEPAEVHKDIPEDLADRTQKPPSHNSLDYCHEDDGAKPNNKDTKATPDSQIYYNLISTRSQSPTIEEDKLKPNNKNLPDSQSHLSQYPSSGEIQEMHMRENDRETAF